MRVDAGDGRQIDDAAPAYRFPDVGTDQDAPEVVRVGEEAPAFARQRVQQTGEQAAVGGQQGRDEAGDHHPGDEVRQIGNGLHDTLDGCARHLVEHERENNGRRKTKNDFQNADFQGVAHHVPEEKGIKEARKVFESHPGAIDDALQAAERRDVLEGDENAGHRDVVEDQEIEQGRRDQQVVKAPLYELFAGMRPTTFARSLKRQRAGGLAHARAPFVICCSSGRQVRHPPRKSPWCRDMTSALAASRARLCNSARSSLWS